MWNTIRDERPTSPRLGQEVQVPWQLLDPPVLSPHPRRLHLLGTAFYIPMMSDWWHVMSKKVRWFLIALFAPEYVLGIALLYSVKAWELRRELKGIFNSDGTHSHDFFIVMGRPLVRVEALGNLSLYDMHESWKEQLIFAREVHFSP